MTTDLAYYQRRARQSRRAATRSPEVCANLAHEAFAAAYDALVEKIDAGGDPAVPHGPGATPPLLP